MAGADLTTREIEALQFERRCNVLMRQCDRLLAQARALEQRQRIEAGRAYLRAAVLAAVRRSHSDN